MKAIPSTIIRTVNDATAGTQTIDLLQTATTQLQMPPLQPQNTSVQNTTQQHQQHHIQTQMQHIQIHQNPPQTGNTHQVTSHQVATATTGHPQQHLQLSQQHHHQHQTQNQPVQVTTQSATLNTNIVTLPSTGATSTGTMKKRKITFSDDDDNIYTTEAVDEQTIVKSEYIMLYSPN